MQIKQAVVGTGAADKHQVIYMVRSVLALDHDPRPDHAADALAAAVCPRQRNQNQEPRGGKEGPHVIVQLTGTLLEVLPSRIVLDVGGVGLRARRLFHHGRGAPARRRGGRDRPRPA